MEKKPEEIEELVLQFDLARIFFAAEEEEAASIVVSLRDITERKRAEEAIKDSLKRIERAKQEWESTADSLPELVCLVDDRGRIIRANRIVETWNLGRVVDVKGREFHELLHSGCADSSCYLDSFWKQAWEEAIRGQPAQCEAYDEVLKRHVLVQIQPWKGTAIGSTVVVVRDITERKRAEEALREAEVMRRTSVSRALIGQMLRDLQNLGGLSEGAMFRAGQELAARVAAESLPKFLEAFVDMGLGTLNLAFPEPGRRIEADEERRRWTFTGDGLVERRTESSQPTCSYARGFLCGAVAHVLGGKRVAGVEMACQSMGDELCRFVVQVVGE